MKNKMIITGLAASLLIGLPLSGSGSNVLNAKEGKIQNDEFSGIEKVEENKIFLNSGIVVTKVSDEKTTATDEDGNLEFEVIRKSESQLELKKFKNWRS